MNNKEIIQNIIVDLRGRRSQEQVSKKMGYTFNQVHKWETSKTKINWLEFVKFAEICGCNVKHVLIEMTFIKKDFRDYKNLIDWFLLGETVESLSQATKISRYKISRWQNKKIIPFLEDILMLLKHKSLTQYFIKKIIGKETEFTKSLKNEFSENQISLILKYPILGAIRTCLSLEQYDKFLHHKDGFIADKLGITIQEEKMYLELMLEHGMIKIENNKYDYDTPVVIGNYDFNAEIAVRKFWNKKIENIFEKLEKDDLIDNFFGFALLPVTENEYIEIKEKYQEFWNAVIEILKKNKDSLGTSLKIMCMQLFDSTLIKKK